MIEASDFESITSQFSQEKLFVAQQLLLNEKGAELTIEEEEVRWIRSKNDNLLPAFELGKAIVITPPTTTPMSDVSVTNDATPRTYKYPGGTGGRLKSLETLENAPCSF